MSHTIIDALDRVIPSLVQPLPRSIVPTDETLSKHTNCLCASRGDFPHQKLLISDYDLTWSILECDLSQCSQEVSAEMVTAWEAAGINWQQRAVINLKVASRELWTHRQLRPDGSLLMALMMHDDGFGSSRILLSGYLQQHFPAGYYVAIPDRRIGIATPSNLSVSERQEIQDSIQSYYDRASMPIGSQLLAPEDLIPQHYYWN
ncbi:hypothetical protein [Chamaesiphon minutus]|uniref:Uncharacterized protein n=1 Tax=Chamaesiphon minutus (strain ATCC 27169 / PCC 6605) TaxID=1173020 RepID=K9UEY2_CHAP6|nr:hypothetical protein [Chamaesiphon minutus]AFY93208.1 hypothetical protein Cha6605_2122 [Chamaesiphon minutus PCC 6605]